MKIDVFAANATTQARLAEDVTQWLASHDSAPQFVACHRSVAAPTIALDAFFPADTTVHGATSCKGVMTHAGPYVSGGTGIFAIWDSDGDYGTGMRPLGDDSRAAARRATQDALLAADRPGEAPAIVWLSCSPGSEEAVLAGIEDVIGGNTPILGGSAADDTVSGEWQVFTATETQANGVIVSVLFPATPLSFAYHSGYAPTELSGKVTKATGRRLQEIDGQPAATVYRNWVGADVIPASGGGDTPILSESTLSPIGRPLDSLGGVPFYLLCHPATAHVDGSLSLFADVSTGDDLTLMRGAPDQLAQRAGKVAALAAESGDMTPNAIAGALMVYCGGCMLAVQDRLDDVVGGVKAALPDTPFMGVYTFGEQGKVVGGTNRHGNLMISAIVFGT